MSAQLERRSRSAQFSLDGFQSTSVARTYPVQRLVEEAILRGEGRLGPGGAVVVATGLHTGRSPEDKYIVRDRETDRRIDWGDVNQPMEAEQFDQLQARMTAYLQGRDLFVSDLAAGADDAHRFPVRVISEHAWHALFAQTMFLPAKPGDDHSGEDLFTVVQAPGFQADPAFDKTRSEVFIALDLTKRLILIGGTHYAGEIKKSIFTVANYLYPIGGNVSMHCSANEGPGGDTALFFGLSGTGKTTLSADPHRRLIGDDEHVWGDDGIFNIEGGCYAKVIGLSQSSEPEIFATTRMFGTVLENVVRDPVTGELDLDSQELTENTRAAYPLSMIPNAKPDGRGSHPRNVIMLTADAFGVLPPVSRLDPDQAMYHFLSGYTAKVAGTERGVIEPSATFSACFASPFLPLPPSTYAELLGERLQKHHSDVWLVNTGWTGGPYGTGHRMPISATRAIITAILNGSLREAQFRTDPVFGLDYATSCPDVSPDLLDPRLTWNDGKAYDRQAKSLAAMFVDNFRQFETASPSMRAAGPSVG